MKLTQELIDEIQEAMLHTNLKGEINWKDGDDIVVQVAGTFAKDKFIVIKNKTKEIAIIKTLGLSEKSKPSFDAELPDIFITTLSPPVRGNPLYNDCKIPSSPIIVFPVFTTTTFAVIIGENKFS